MEIKEQSWESYKVGHSGPLKVLIPSGGLALSSVGPGTEVLKCAEFIRLSDPETHANHDV